MARRALIAVVVLVAAACGGGSTTSSPAPAPAVQYGQLRVGEIDRSYRTFVPTTLDLRQPVPLVVVLHGGGNSVESTLDTMQFDQAAAVGNFMVAYPEATNLEWNAGFCCGSAPERGVDDVAFLTQLLDTLEADYPVDPTRVFMAGVSNGAMMAYRFACERADRVTAFASVAGAVTVEDCTPSRPVSVLELHGTEDPLVPYHGGSADVPGITERTPYPSAPELAQRWADINECPLPPTTRSEGPVTVTEWGGCAQGSAVTLMSVEGGGHVWFAPGLGPVNGALDATAVIRRFFDAVAAG